MKAILPCAGYATRLYPLTENQPKALLEVKGRPILSHIVSKVGEIKAVDEIMVVTNDKFHSHFAEWAKSVNSKVPIKVINDRTTSNETRLGQIGDINFVLKQEKIDDDVLVVAGDNLFNFSLLPAHNLFVQKNKFLNALYDVKSIESAKELGIAKIDENRRITGFVEKPREPPSTLASLGIYFIPRHEVSLIKKYLDEGNNPDKMGFFIAWMLKNSEVHSHVYREKWFDIGWLESLEEARREFEG